MMIKTKLSDPLEIIRGDPKDLLLGPVLFVLFTRDLQNHGIFNVVHTKK